MRTLWISATVMLLALACAAPVFAVSGEYDKGPVGNKDWPAGLADLLNSQERVYACWVNWFDKFYYEGDTDAFNAFLKRYAQVDVTPHTLVLHFGGGSATRVLGGDIGFDWAVTGECWGKCMKPGQRTSTIVNVDEALEQGERIPAIVNVELYLGWHVSMADVVVPPGIELRFAGDLGADALRRLEPPLGRRTAEGRFSCDNTPTALMLGAGAQGERNIARLLSIRFERAQDSGIQAAIDTVLLSGPKGRWLVRLDLLDAQRRTLARGKAVFENSGVIKTLPAIQLGRLQLRISQTNPRGTLQLDLSPTNASEPLDVGRAASFRVGIGEADQAARVTATLKEESRQ